MDMSGFLIFVSSALMLIGTYIIWFSRYNIPCHLLLGTVFVGYFVPLFLTDILTRFPAELVNQYAWILCIGAFTYVLGLFYGFNYIPLDAIIKRPTFIFSTPDVFVRHRYKYLVGLTVFSLITMALCWMVIGTVPMFSSDPFSAKFFKGQFYEAYMRVAIPYRLAQTIQITLFPVLVAAWFVTRRKLLLILIVLVMLFFSFALTRGLVFSGIFTLIALFASRKRAYVFWFIFTYVTIFSIGSALYFLIGLLFSNEAYGAVGLAGESIWTIIAAGSPDISDQLRLLGAFEHHGTYTFGRTFWGGLVPGQYYWNPSAWALYVLNDTDDISALASGGFRLPVAMWGYFAFGWIGVIIVPAFSGMLLGASTRYVKRLISHKNILQSILALSFYAVIMGFFYNFYLMSMYALPSCLILIGLFYKFRWKSEPA